MRLKALALTLLLGGGAAYAQVWEKPIVPGLTYRMEYDATLPRAIYALRLSPTLGGLKAVPELAQGKVYADDDSKGRETVTSMVSRTGAIAGLNGDFFPFTGSPLGMMVRDGQLLSTPVKPRAAFGWGPAGSGTGIINWRLTLTGEGMDPLDVDGVNRQVPPGCCIVFDPFAGLALSTKSATCVIVRMDKPALGPTGEFTGTVQSTFGDVTSVPVGSDALVLLAEGSKAAYLNALHPGQTVTFSVQADGLDWSKFPNVIGGGPQLLQNGHAFVDWQDEGFKEQFAMKRYARSAIGRTKDGDIWMVAVDGRPGISAGATLDEMAATMLRLGCTDAINLDGGGSTDMNLLGVPLNRPSLVAETGETQESGERKIANAILIYGSPPPSTGDTLKVVAPASINAGDQADIAVVGEDGTAIPNAEIIWAASGNAFIDQGGRLRAITAGPVTVLARARGQIVTMNITIGAASPAKPNTSGGTPPSAAPPKKPAKSL